ncbi:DUF5007 domain-containing protein [Pedobacter sp. N36a]|uniref:DUF5007 domain-containing protein n=1 Tax=Pedobacter sp. N36a TaxID=2767996 RepID=UPI00165732E4|nr:DUF5007 domain-containing protein [Pedobacter sp. N36a]MBC8986307.1 DUF5007 domain-containing protein [Pedobacter sp. N36a]
MNNKYPLAPAILFLGLAVLVVLGCKKNFPDVREALGNDSRFTNITYEPILGRNTLFTGNFFAGSSSQPLNFKIINMRKRDGSAAPELTENVPVYVWKQPYLGDEKSLAEIDAKRAVEYHPTFEVREHSGQFLMWANNSTAIKTQPDSGYVFDIEMSNKGGRRYFRDFKLKPLKARPFEPSNLDPLTGMERSKFVRPTAAINMVGDKTGAFLFSSDIEVYFKKDNLLSAEKQKNQVTIKLVDSLYKPINPDKFRLTDWKNLMHGFNMNKTDSTVTYDVAYPIPLITYQTKYTSPDGAKSRLYFSYDRLGFGGKREVAGLLMDFNIFEPGSWNIIIRFSAETPKFTND